MTNDVSRELFSATFGTDPAVVASAPGRVNLIGEHTDYHQGFVLPTVLPQRTAISLSPRPDGRVRIVSNTMDDGIREFSIGAEWRDRTWLDYVKGVTAALTAAGIGCGGFDAAIASTLPAGGGVSSSAALTVALLRALRDAALVSIDDLELARLAQRAETDFVGAPIGIMDQMACSLGREGEALFIDTRSLDYQRIAFPAALALVVIDSGITHAHAGGGYQERREQSFAAAKALGVAWLRDASENALSSIDDAVLRRRARHVITENARVLESVDALREGDLPRLGKLFSASHASQRDDYETSTPEIDALAEIGDRDAAIFGARLTGGGFGGSVVMLAAADGAAAAAARILSEYQRTIGESGGILLPYAAPARKDSIPCV